MNSHRTARRIARLAARAERGVSLVETAVVLSIAAVLVGLAVPSFEGARERRHLEGAAALLETDLQLARSEALLRGGGVRLDFQRQGGASCYVMHTGNAGDCSCIEGGAPVCRGNLQPLRSAFYGAAAPVGVASNSASMLFDDVHGTVTPTATLRVTSHRGDTIHQVVNIMGRVRSCSPTGLAGYRAC